MRLVEKRRVWQGITVTAAVLAMTVVLPAQPAAAAAGEVWIDASYGTGGATVLPDAYYGVRFSMDSTGRQYIGNQTLAEGTDLRRLTADGAVDLAFAGGNLALPRLIRDVHADASGTVTVVGSGPGITVSRFTSAGELDLGFGTGGSAVVPGSEQAQGYFGLLGRANGGYIVAYPIGPAPQTVLVALTSTGAVDGTWAPGSPQPGVLTTPDYTRSVVADGNAVVLLANPDANSPQGEYLRRLTPSGAPDPAFGTGGRLNLPDHPQFVADTVTVSDGASFVAGRRPGDAPAMAVAKVSSAGALDASFGTGGMSVGRSDPCVPEPSRISVGGGHVVIAGSFGGCGHSALLVDRFTLSGQLDTAFGEAGELRINSVAGDPFNHLDILFDLHARPDGRTAVAGFVEGRQGRRAVALRLLNNAAPPAAGAYVPLPPARILDTRSGNGAVAGAVPGGGSVDLQVTGRGGVPSSGVGAVVLNVTVTQPVSDGNVVVFPTGSAVPLASNLNFVPAQTIPNLVTVMVGAGGRVTLKNNSVGAVQLVADVGGYYRSGSATLAGMFTPLVPARILDTRTGNGAPIGSIAGNSYVDLPVSGRGGVPFTGVSAVVFNLTVTQPSWDGNIFAHPTGEFLTAASNLNFGPGQTIANLVTVKVGTGGTVTLHNNSTGTVHLVADVAGYYLAGPAVAPGAFVAMTPVRFLDTRAPAGVPVAGPLAAGAVLDQPGPNTLISDLTLGSAAVLNVTVTRPSWDGTMVAYPKGTLAPLASNLNFVAGQTIANQVVVKVGDSGLFSLKNNSFGTVHLVADLFGYFLT